MTVIYFFETLIVIEYVCAEGGPRLPIAHALRLLSTQKCVPPLRSSQIWKYVEGKKKKKERVSPKKMGVGTLPSPPPNRHNLVDSRRSACALGKRGPPSAHTYSNFYMVYVHGQCKLHSRWLKNLRELNS